MLSSSSSWLPSLPILKGYFFFMRICYHVINIKMIHLILVRLQTTSGYVSHCSIKGGRGAQLPLVEQKKEEGEKKKTETAPSPVFDAGPQTA